MRLAGRVLGLVHELIRVNVCLVYGWFMTGDEEFFSFVVPGHSDLQRLDLSLDRIAHEAGGMIDCTEVVYTVGPDDDEDEVL